MPPPAISREEAEARFRAMQEAYAQEVRRVYAEAEYRMLGKVARRIERGIDGAGWAEKKLAEITVFNAEISNEVRDLRKLDPRIEQAINDAYDAGANRAGAELIEAQLTDLFADVPFARGAAVRTLAATTVDALQSSHLGILRTTMDGYRAVIARASSQVAVGTMTRRQAAQAALNDFARRGISGFVDSAGRKWDIASYAEMAVRSATGQAAVQGHSDKLEANGYDLEIVSDSPEECPLCRPWEGKVYSISGNNPDYPSKAEAIAAGLFHASCSHRGHLFIPGVNRRYTNTENPEGYEERQKQRYNERMIRQWKNRAAVAVEPKDKALAAAKVKEWQARQRAFIEETGRRRDYGRESVTRAR